MTFRTQSPETRVRFLSARSRMRCRPSDVSEGGNYQSTRMETGWESVCVFMKGWVFIRSPRLSGPGQGVVADEQVAGAEPGRAFQKQHRPECRQRRGKPRAMQSTIFRQSPRWTREIQPPGQFFRRCGQIGVPNGTRHRVRRCQQRWCLQQRGRARRRVERIQKIGETPVKGVPCGRPCRHLRQTVRSHSFPSSKRPSTRYWVRIGMRFSG